MARKGHKHKHGFEGGQMRLIRRIPKRGFKSHSRRAWVAVNVGDLDRFSDGAEVTVGMIREAGLAGGTGTGVKVLGGGDLSRKLTVKVHAFSASARRKIEAAGGSCEVIAQP
jgi:large subunit ribosomal protein L15